MPCPSLMMKNNTSTNPIFFKKKLASRFLKKLKKISTSSSSSPSSVRAAAYASMASTVGPRRAWSRALLRKTRVGGTRRGRSPRKFGHEGRLKELSEVVPGGEAMDSWSLLNETPHYIKCLTAQLQIMRQILHSSSSSSTIL